MFQVHTTLPTSTSTYFLLLNLDMHAPSKVHNNNIVSYGHLITWHYIHTNHKNIFLVTLAFCIRQLCGVGLPISGIQGEGKLTSHITFNINT